MLLRITRAILHGIYVSGIQLIYMPSYLMYMLLLRPLTWFAVTTPLYWRFEGYIHSVMTYMFATWAVFTGHTIVEVGDDLRPCCTGDRVILMSNHQSAMDIPIIAAVMAGANKGVVKRYYSWIMHKMFFYTHFGVVGQIRGDFFIETGKEVRELQPKLLAQYVKDVFLERGRRWLVVFPEGGFLHKRLKDSQQYAKKHDLPILEHTTLPRLGAMKALFSAMPRDNSWVIDTTIAYPQGKCLDLHHMTFAWHKPCSTIVHHRKYHLSEIPTDDANLTQWLYDRYAEKDKLLKDYYATGELPASENGRAPFYLTTKPWLAGILAVVQIASLYFVIYLIKFPFSFL
ncbi:hypothetical protein CAPTEDRAFT_112881 [Capitella teleta]|uniref:Phospholipid/glycerol acyltransferase domain-containing protein n=1 Tax=Capitella teleta TaxID=283909 RepID=R7VB26_CAPTE|nr:hypothetical protein CAPTEDRAFT_112881 [Capitella teleta]|eukprot:ELU12910.1 hypothetical protein CAPTEDRAFT_112881 [Capitella teleta]